jgi:hypothetical protein
VSHLERFLWVAAILQWLFASSNLFAARLLRYRQNIAGLAPFIREVFIVQSVYIMGMVAVFGVICIAFAPDLAGQSALERFLSACLAIFWGMRITIQLFFYDRDVKRQWPVANLCYLTTFIYLSSLFTIAALQLHR